MIAACPVCRQISSSSAAASPFLSADRSRSRAYTALLLACHAIDDPSDCATLDSRDDCEDAELERGQCLWLEVITPTADEPCTSAPRTHACIGFHASTQQGCGGYDCGSDAPSLYSRAVDDGIEVFASPLCGPEPAGDWEPCSGAPASPCICGCHL